MYILHSKGLHVSGVHGSSRFLAKYTAKENGFHEESPVLNLSGTCTLSESRDFHQKLNSPSPTSDTSTVSACHSQQEQSTKGAHTRSVITPLDLQINDQTCRKIEDSESTDAATSSPSMRDLYHKDERLVEGSSVKSQPRSKQSHDQRTTHLKHTCPTSSDVGQLRGQGSSRSNLSSIQTSVTGGSCRTTASEAEFRSDLASLDADIARLQMQFRVAMLTPLPR